MLQQCELANFPVEPGSLTFRRLKCSPLEVFWRCYLGLFKSTAAGESTRNNLNIGLIRDVGICKLMNEWGDFKQCLAVKQKEGLVPDAESDLGSLCSKAVWSCPSDCRFRSHLEPTSFTPSSQGRPRSAAWGAQHSAVLQLQVGSFKL